MRIVASCVAVVLCLASGCSLAGGGGEGAASCAFVADYDGRRYSGLYGAEFTLGEAVGTAVLPACDDTGGDGDPGVGAREVTAYAVAGVDPAVAIVVGGVADTLLVVQGARGQLPPEVVRLVGRGE
ncbi:hypothetical protein IAG44_26235 [Streptomyces roseirectus]|uniref:Lipoprotein n=1 Tax=Streptomyces roseirectus TaxID=2768066 RepID=A0A7H0IIG3_9ACTN|nr:DUF6281 family protein [Streptomyces roseirectus]QNP72579.1 hypothetical protein IAG44_26235 [Streptomyces roseirectus]